jgi:UDP-N-acetylmuramyl pentapeptide phosphotransferase/UDP-N-acetylglucosamine-1-phosphate transferase
MLPSLALSFAVAAVITLLIIRSSHLHGGISADHDLSGPQKFHAMPVPRIGGLAIFSGFIVGALLLAYKYPDLRGKIGWLAVCCLPAFGSGLIEDLTKQVSPLRRLLATLFAGGLGAWLLGAQIKYTAVPGLDLLAETWIGGYILALFVVSGVSNSINIIDGMNGLASMCSTIMFAGLAYVALQAGDQFVAAMAIAVIGAVLGFFMWNYPSGLIFLGDGGAYFLGFLLSELAILLLVRNPSVSPMFPLLLCAYPVWETVFSIYRRKVVRGRPAGMPDGIHLHSLIYRRLMRWAIGSKDAAVLTRRNALTAPYLWVLCSLSVVPATIWWDDTTMLQMILGLFVVCYVLLYWRIVRFRTPRWMVLNSRAESQPPAARSE